MCTSDLKGELEGNKSLITEMFADPFKTSQLNFFNKTNFIREILLQYLIVSSLLCDLSGFFNSSGQLCKCKQATLYLSNHVYHLFTPKSHYKLSGIISDVLLQLNGFYFIHFHYTSGLVHVHYKQPALKSHSPFKLMWFSFLLDKLTAYNPPKGCIKEPHMQVSMLAYSLQWQQWYNWFKTIQAVWFLGTWLCNYKRILGECNTTWCVKGLHQCRPSQTWKLFLVIVVTNNQGDLIRAFLGWGWGCVVWGDWFLDKESNPPVY